MSDQKKDASQEITLEVAGRLLEITPERIRQLAKGGYITIHKRGFTTLVSAVQGYVRFLKEDARKNTQTQAASRATDARAREIELRIAASQRELIPREDATLALELLAGAVNKEFTGFAARVTRDVPLRRKIEAELYETKRKIAEALGSSQELARTGRDPTDPDPA